MEIFLLGLIHYSYAFKLYSSQTLFISEMNQMRGTTLRFLLHMLLHEKKTDCIGSAFNSKGAMQCPNCRKIEKGQWLYANGSRPLPEFSMDDWAHDEDLYDLNYSEMVIF